MLSLSTECSGHLVGIHYYILPGWGPIVLGVGSSVLRPWRPARRLVPVRCCQVLCLDILLWVCSRVANIQKGYGAAKQVSGIMWVQQLLFSVEVVHMSLHLPGVWLAGQSVFHRCAVEFLDLLGVMMSAFCPSC